MANDKERANSTPSYTLGLAPFPPLGEKKEEIAKERVDEQMRNPGTLLGLHKKRDSQIGARTQVQITRNRD